MDDKEIVFNQSLLYLIFIPFLLLFSFQLTSIITKDFNLSILIGIIIPIIYLLYFFLTYKKIYINNNSLTIKSKLKTRNILWKDVESMSTNFPIYYKGALRYQIKTSQGTITIPLMKKNKLFEALMEKYGSLELVGESSIPNFLGPSIKRWKKIGQTYQATGLSDYIGGIFYPQNQKILLLVVFGVIFIVFLFNYKIILEYINLVILQR